MENYEIEFNHSTSMYEVITVASKRFVSHFKRWSQADVYIRFMLGGY